MGLCIYCGKPAGFLRKEHPACKEQHDLAVTRIPEVFAKKALEDIEPHRFRELVEESARAHFVKPAELRPLVVKGLQDTIDAAFARGLTEQDDIRITSLCGEFDVSERDLGFVGSRLIKAKILRQLDAGEAPDNVGAKQGREGTEDLSANVSARVESGETPREALLHEAPNMVQQALETGLAERLAPHLHDIIFERGEAVIWVFNFATYSTMRNRTKYVGASVGTSVRVMKGLYFRVGAFGGEPIKTQELSDEGEGSLVLASRNVYFQSDTKALKIPIKKILSVHPYSDAIQLIRDGANAVPQIFKIDDPPFAADVIARLHQNVS